MYEFDVADKGEAVPKFKRASQLQSDYFREMFARMAPKEKRESCVRNICHIINKISHLPHLILKHMFTEW